jgi:spore coat polysaccharide biosynthesis predicted glycosyltransferase SpsG
MRSLALAEALAELGIESIFAGEFDAAIRTRIESAGMRCDTAERSDVCGVVIDSYQQRPQHDVAPVLLIDDFAALDRYDCAAVLNFTMRSADLAYPRGPRLFLGPRWFPARRALRLMRGRGQRREIGDVRHVLVAVALDDMAVPVLEALQSFDRDVSVHVVVGKSRAEMEDKLRRFRADSRVLTGLPDLAAELAWADVCIATAGLTKYEAAYLGVPSLLIPQNEGQDRDADFFDAAGVAINLGVTATDLEKELHLLMSDRALRESMRRKALGLFPDDPTRDLASALVANVFVRSAEASGAC